MAAAATLDGVIQATKEALEEVERYTPDKTSAPTRPLLVFFFKHPSGEERTEDDKISMQMGKSEYASKIIIEEIEVGVAVGGFSLPDGIYARLAHVTKYSTVLLCCVGHPSRAPKKTAGDYNFSLYRTQINAMFAPVTTYLRSIGHCNVATAVFGIILDGMKSTDGSDKLPLQHPQNHDRQLPQVPHRRQGKRDENARSKLRRLRRAGRSGGCDVHRLLKRG